MKIEFRCCFKNCKFEHDSLIMVITHLAKRHKLRINKRNIIVNSVDSETVEDITVEVRER